MEAILTVIIAAKDPPPHVLGLCLASFGRLESASRIEIVIVATGIVPSIDAALSARFASLKIEYMPAQGIYAAYNRGITYASAPYTCFFGIDDIALPGLDRLIEELDTCKAQDIDFVAACCYMQNVGMSKPTNWRPSILFRNWCHQGLFYSSDYLQQNHYDVRYFAQADHRMNIDILSDKTRNVRISPEVVSYFSAGGVSQARYDLEFRKALPQIADAAFGRHYGLLVRIKQKLADLIKGNRLA